MTKNINYWFDPSVLKDSRGDIEFFIPPITSAKEVFPKWFKDIPKYYDGSNSLRVNDGQANIGVKGCYPFIDTFTSGYVIKLHCDVLVEKGISGISVNWTHDISPIVGRSIELVNGIPNFSSFTSFEFAWELFYRIRLPKGYSALFVHPLNRTDLPFISSSGIVDADGGMANGSIPFSLDKNFEGIIPEGTPIIQIIPFKRDSWKANYTKQPKNFYWNPRKNITGWYKKNIWKRKSYE